VDRAPGRESALKPALPPPRIECSSGAAGGANRGLQTTGLGLAPDFEGVVHNAGEFRAPMCLFAPYQLLQTFDRLSPPDRMLRPRAPTAGFAATRRPPAY